MDLFHFNKTFYNKEIYKERFEYCYKLAIQGDKEMQYVLAHYYYSGEGIKQDSKQGIYWLKKSAYNRHKSAIKNLYYIYKKGNDNKKGI
jgi:TPR repeat protein